MKAFPSSSRARSTEVSTSSGSTSVGASSGWAARRARRSASSPAKKASIFARAAPCTAGSALFWPAMNSSDHALNSWPRSAGTPRTLTMMFIGSGAP